MERRKDQNLMADVLNGNMGRRKNVYDDNGENSSFEQIIIR